MASSTVSPDANVDISMSFRLCENCGFTKIHSKEYNNAEFRTQHFTCLCNLLESSLVCCSQGYSNLLTGIPALAISSPLPQSTSRLEIDIIAGEEIGISSDEIQYLKQECLKIRILTLALYYHKYINQKLIPLYFMQRM